MQLKEMARNVKLHGIKCYNILARGIKHMSYSRESNKLAVLRNDYNIEIWNFSYAPFIERVIPGVSDCALEQVCWVDKKRLFAVSLSGAGLIEYDLKTLKAKRKLLLTGDKGLCIDYHKKSQKIAIGTEEGFINIFDVRDDDLQYVRVLDRQDHRIVCLKFNNIGDCVVSGSQDAVKVWSVKTGHVIHKISTGRTDQYHETTVWCVEVLKDFTIVTGDSRGRLSFWDGNLGTQIDWVQSSSADILCLALSEDENSVYCSGIEQVVRKYTKICVMRDGQKFDQWVRNAKRFKLHTHDVLALKIISDNQIVSGGIDGFLSLSSKELKIIDRFGPFLKHPFAISAGEARMMLMMYTNYFEIWKLAKAHEEMEQLQQEASGEEYEDNNDEILKPAMKKIDSRYYKMSNFPEKYVEFRSKGDEMIVCATISNNGKWVAYSTPSSVRLFYLSLEQKKPEMIRIKNLPEEFTNCNALTFTKDSKTLISVESNGICKIFDLCTNELEYRQSIDLNDFHSDLIHLVAVSNCSKFLIFASLCNNISVWTFKKRKYVHANSLPKHSCAATALKISDDGLRLIVAYANNRIIEYNLEEFFIQFSPCLQQESTRNLILDICLDPHNSDIIMFTQNNAIIVIKKENSKDEEKSSVKKTKIQSVSDGMSYSVKAIKKFDTILIHLEWLGDDELIVLEMNPISLMENLPPPLRRKVFGAM